MGYKLDYYIERQLYDEFGWQKIYMEEIHLTGNGVTDTVSLKQGDMCITMTNTQAIELRELLERVS